MKSSIENHIFKSHKLNLPTVHLPHKRKLKMEEGGEEGLVSLIGLSSPRENVKEEIGEHNPMSSSSSLLSRKSIRAILNENYHLNYHLNINNFKQINKNL